MGNARREFRARAAEVASVCHNTSRPRRSAIVMHASAPELNSRKSLSMPSLKIRPCSGICEATINGLAAVDPAEDQRRRRSLARKRFPHRVKEVICVPRHERERQSRRRPAGVRRAARGGDRVGAGEQALEPAGRAQARGDDDSAGRLRLLPSAVRNRVPRRDVGTRANEEIVNRKDLPSSLSVTFAIVTARLGRSPAKVSRIAGPRSPTRNGSKTPSKRRGSGLTPSTGCPSVYLRALATSPSCPSTTTTSCGPKTKLGRNARSRNWTNRTAAGLPRSARRRHGRRRLHSRNR